MMTVPWGLLIGAALGAYQNEEQRKNAAKDRKLAAATAMYSPWTGLKPNMDIQRPDVFGTVGKGALAGMSYDQGAAGAENQNALNEARINYYNRAADAGDMTDQEMMDLDTPYPSEAPSQPGADTAYNSQGQLNPWYWLFQKQRQVT